MSGLVHHIHVQAVKVLLYMTALASVHIGRVCPGGDDLEIIAAHAQPSLSPQDMLVRLTTIMIAGSLTMLAVGYSAPARTLPG